MKKAAYMLIILAFLTGCKSQPESTASLRQRYGSSFWNMTASYYAKCENQKGALIVSDGYYLCIKRDQLLPIAPEPADRYVVRVEE